MTIDKKRIVLLQALFVASLLVSQTVFAKVQATRIEHVTLYPSIAIISRTGEISLSKGENTLFFKGLPPHLDHVQVELQESSAVLGQIKIKQRKLAELVDETGRNLADELESLELKKSELQDANTAAELQLEFIKSVSQGYAEKSWADSANGNTDLDSWSQALSVVETSVVSASKTIRDNNIKIKKLDKEISFVKKEIRAAGRQTKSLSDLEVTVFSPTAMNTTITFRYGQDNARWKPLYEARLDTKAGTLSLKQKADISQNTSEDWEDVRLTLATNDPDQDAAMPEFYGETIEFRKPRLRSSSSSSRAYGGGGTEIEEVVLAGEKLADAGIENVEDVAAYVPNLVIEEYNLLYEVPGRVNIAKRKDESELIELKTLSYEVDLLTRIRPRESTQPFLNARLDFKDKFPLMASDMILFVDGAYVGDAWLPTILPGQVTILPMGQDNRVLSRISYQHDANNTGGVVSRRKTDKTHLVFSIQNTHAKDVQVEVFDHYPVSKDSKIKVKVDPKATKPDATDVDEIKGQVVWRKNLKPQEQWEITQRYSVSYPKDKSLDYHHQEY